ncbi:MAG: malonyl-CoA decarboxylase family protein [Acidimicrobiia bacterium]
MSTRRFDRLRRTLRRSKDLVDSPSLSDADAQRVVEAVDALLTEPDTTTKRAAAERLVDAYLALDDTGRTRFMETVAVNFGTDADAVDAAAATLRTATGPDERLAAERALRRAVTPRYAELLHVVTGMPHGVSHLVGLRADLLAVASPHPALGLFGDELAGHLSTLFDVGLLELRQITWDSPASVLERLMATERVHEISGWDDVQHRLTGDQRVYGFFHPALPNEPIAFVEVALSRGLADDLVHLLERDAPVERPDTAIFYAITSAQPGLGGIHLGNELIKQVVDALRRADDRLERFATLSPLPRFRSWLVQQVRDDALTPFEAAAFGDDALAVAQLTDRAWIDDPTIAERVKPAILSAASRYLATTTPDREPARVIDPVENFHLSNGASVEQLNWMANPAPYGIEQSLGLMVNYLYDRGRIASTRGYLIEGTVRRVGRRQGSGQDVEGTLIRARIWATNRVARLLR